MVSAVVVVPKLGDYEDLLALDKSFLNRTLDALASLVLVLVIIGTVEKAVANFDSLNNVLALLHRKRVVWQLIIRCRRYLRPGQPELSKDQSPREACCDRRPV